MIKNQKKKENKGLKKLTRIIIKTEKKGRQNKIKTIRNNKKIPNNLSVTDLSTAYKGKKYHSGTICGGVTKKLAI